MRPRTVGVESQLPFPSPYCDTCMLAHLCDERMTPLGCSPFGPHHPALMHPTKPDWNSRWIAINGPDFNYRSRRQVLPRLPGYIPRIRPGPVIGSYRGLGPVAIPLSVVVGLAKRARELGITARDMLGLSPDQLLLVLGFESDAFLEKGWTDRRSEELLTAIADIRPDAAVAWNFSVWHRHALGWLYPRAEHLYSVKRSLVSYADLQSFGVVAIPHLYWGTHEDLDRWVVWLREHPWITAVAIDLQTANRSRDWRAAAAAVGRLSERLPRDIQILFSGIGAPERIRELRWRWPNSCFSNSHPMFDAQLSRRRLLGSEEGTQPWQVFQQSVDEFREIVDATPAEWRPAVRAGFDVAAPHLQDR
jgi:hypothetical protein